MRKALVVVCGVTAAALLAGGITATTALADSSPDEPGLPGIELPDLSQLPQWPADPGTAPDAGDANDADQADGADQDARPGDDQAPDDQAADDQAADDQGDRDGTDDQRSHAGQGDSGGQPAQHRPGAVAARPDIHRQTAQRPAAVSPLAAAHREVSPRSVSLSPAAPFQQQILALVNENRRRGGCGRLTLDGRLIAAAYRHAADMARRGYFAHQSPNGDGAGDRVDGAGYRWKRYGENIARGPESPYEVVDGWMHSPDHRENIMDCDLDQMGIGLAFDPERQPYWVQDFATPKG
jgi:uncharacterized protein YkwD